MMERAERIAATQAWDAAWDLELAGARRRALTAAMRRQTNPTLRDLLALVGEGVCDLADTPEAGRVRIGDLVHRDGEGPFVEDLLIQLGLGLEAPLDVARRSGLAKELARPLVSLLADGLGA